MAKNQDDAPAPEPDAGAAEREMRADYAAFVRVRNLRKLKADFDSLTITGLRLIERDNPENGRVLVFDEAEAAVIMAAVREVVEARPEEA